MLLDESCSNSCQIDHLFHNKECTVNGSDNGQASAAAAAAAKEAAAGVAALMIRFIAAAVVVQLDRAEARNVIHHHVHICTNGLCKKNFDR